MKTLANLETPFECLTRNGRDVIVVDVTDDPYNPEAVAIGYIWQEGDPDEGEQPGWEPETWDIYGRPTWTLNRDDPRRSDYDLVIDDILALQS